MGEEYKVYCGECGNEVKPTIYDKMIPVYEHDKKNGYTRNYSYSCCGKLWPKENLIDED